MSVTALNGAELDDLQAHDFADYAGRVPGLSLNAAQPGLTRLTLRGQNAGGVGSTVAVYVDESPFGSSTGLLNGAVDTGDFDISAIASSVQCLVVDYISALALL